MAEKSSVTRAQAEAHRRALAALLKLDANRRCAECGGRGPTWASVNLGVFVCLNCSGEFFPLPLPPFLFLLPLPPLATPLHTLMVHFVKKVNFYFQLIKVVYRQ